MSFARRPAVVAVAFASLLAAMLAVVSRYAEAAPPRPEQWKKVEEAEKKGLPQTAIKELEPIIASALTDKAYPEAIKALAKKIALEGNIQGNKPEERITRMKAEIAKAPKEIVPVLDTILAHWYWHYFQQNRWRFMQRTATSAPPGEDFTTWDLPRLFGEIDAQFTKALSAEKELKATPIGTYDALLTKGTLPDTYRPTLFDFIAFEALNFYASPEQAGAKAEDTFEVDASSPALGNRDEFLKWAPQTTDASSRLLKAFKLFQNLLTFHANDTDKTALLDADLFRLQFANAHVIGEEKSARYKAALLRFADDNAKHELSALARFRLAQIVDGEGDRVEARKIAQQAVNAYPDSLGGKQAFNLILQIEAKAVQIHTERVWTDPLPVIRVQYRNITGVHFRVYKADWAARLGGQYRRPEALSPEDRRAFLAKKPDLEFSTDLPATPDYLERTHDVPAPKDLKPGFYFLFASPDPKFLEADNPISATDVWVSDLALVTRNDWGNPSLDGFVLKGNSGEPVVGAKVRTWTRDNQGHLNAGPTVETDKNGQFVVAGAANRGVLLLASFEGQELAAMNDYYVNQYDRTPKPYGHTVLFTDRSLYRPGQMVQFKGICLHVDQQKDGYETIKNKSVTVHFRDPNGQEVFKLETKSNDYGSFSGSFTAPRDRLTGRFMIQVDQDVPGNAFINVEEYKRPKFKVDLEAPKEPAKLGAEVKITGKAIGYTGAAIGGAKVRYHVVRQVQFPMWWYGFYSWRMPPRFNSAQEIAHGTAVTEADGSFTVTFPAAPDRTAAVKDEPTFTFTVSADVTDTTGETRSASRGVRVGYAALQASLSTEEWLTADKDMKLTVTTQTLDGEGKAAKGTVKVYALKAPAKVQRPELLGGRIPPRPRRGVGAAPAVVPAPTPDPGNPMNWDEGEVVATLPFTTDASGKVELTTKLPAGAYRAKLETQDEFGKPVTGKHQFTVVDPAARALALKIPHLFAAPKWSLEPGQEFSALWGTGYDTGRAFIEIEHRNKIVQAFWTEAGSTQATVKQAVTEAMRGGFTVRSTFVRENRAYLDSRHVDVPWTNKDLKVKWERFVSKLEPGQKEKWTAVVTGPDAKKAVAEMVAALYDESLDAYLPHDWLHKFNVFRQDHSNRNAQFENAAKYFNDLTGSWVLPFKQIAPGTHRAFPADVTVNLHWYEFRGRGGFGGGAVPMAAAAPGGMGGGEQLRQNRALGEKAALGFERDGVEAQNGARRKGDDGGDKRAEASVPPGGGADQGPDLSKVSARVNLQETAFFFPHLVSDQAGEVRMEFTMPEALTKWKFLGFAHDRELRSGFLGGETVTAKDLMVQPNPPRFLREGDLLEFSVKVSNQASGRATGKVRLTFADARTGKPVDIDIGNTETADQPFEIASKESKSFSWKLTVPDGMGPVTYKAVGATDRFSDGEEGALPVLSKRILVTESLPLPIRGKTTKTFDFAKLRESAKSDTLKTQSLTVQMTSNPAWYAVMALPYLMESQLECSEQVFNRLYANALARSVAQSNPKIRKVFDQWKNTPALDSPLEKNQDVKSVILAETPWVRAALKESEARRNVGILFDDNRLNEETARQLRKLAEMQHGDGAWPWFPGGPANDYITLYITTGFGRLRHLGVKLDVAPAVKSLTRLDAWADKIYRDILAHSKNKDDNHLSTTIALYLYGRSFFLQDKPVAKEHQEAVTYWQGQAKKHWLQLANRQGQAHLALALKRFGDKETPAGILASIKERSVTNEEMGMFWRDTEYSWWWYHAPIETQAVMIEALDEVANDAKAVEECKVWLLKQKQTQNWKTTKATADAAYALLLRGDNLLASDELVDVTLGAEHIKPEAVEAGTGYYEQKFVRSEVKPEFGTIKVTKADAGVSWGAAHWQYLEDVSKVTPHTGTPLKLEKKLFKRVFTKTGPVLEAVTGPVAVGDELVVRIVLRTDRDMEYVHLKDHRGSGTEPVNVLSRYKYQDGLGYYEATKDTASHFFMDYLPKGTYVFEYALRVQHRGKYPTGLANIQCLYAPEFNSHSESIMIEAK
ncbi:alpha-2-macroglobulin family protein [Fimbriiglobus ruber]|uniref:Alpha-2-macroglobulin domain protein n=1 Tax=Fimbriiglobus ruber TaxID=1908690 RepID=A0A225D4E5_9BACT|nr:MG2 domain-containing protein [Fimbriiglobus ruber]OWK36471.1 alpha-2-macroglobulin domain protein [Fimbriiglobus ruber]